MSQFKFPVFFSAVVLLTAPIVWLSGCSTTPVEDTSPPQILIAEGKEMLEVDNGEEAKLKFQSILEDYPDSKERVTALLLLARAYYQDREYEESKFHFNKFIELYPAHPNVDHAHFYKAMSDYKMMDISSRDQASTRDALEGFENLIKNFPKSSYRKKAEEKKHECWNNLAKNYFEIGKFYFRTGSYQSAIIRFKKFINLYPNQSFMDEAVFLLGESYFNEQNYQEAKGFYKKLLKQYPRSLFAKEARLRLRKLH
ncbi:MAG: outer membrane protein assembly factor BamD [Nitrospinota bacterium]|nr:outer membrane protein assembly factor BamD [Nitrospinota bacterium]